MISIATGGTGEVYYPYGGEIVNIVSQLIPALCTEIFSCLALILVALHGLRERGDGGIPLTGENPRSSSPGFWGWIRP